MPYLIDTDVLIDASRGKPEAREFLKTLAAGWAISRASAMELIVGARNKLDLAGIDKLISTYKIVPFKGLTGTLAYGLLKRYAKSDGLHLFDSLIAATAIENNLTLVTRNLRHFGMIDGLTVELPPH